MNPLHAALVEHQQKMHKPSLEQQQKNKQKLFYRQLPDHQSELIQRNRSGKMKSLESITILLNFLFQLSIEKDKKRMSIYPSIHPWSIIHPLSTETSTMN
ncbi:hypothetical protein ATANTOWER_008393 [Ataeniobius toweri]|uniref:Uncharacterized protein n=1 Tax=Ataeniobius toweri TaxID=208326 RepID=A0ABU7C5A6_9TELE|nr:hypothetical protein [Ataeniobius toweri]